MAVAEDLEALLTWMVPALGDKEMPAAARAGLAHVADGIQCLRWLRDANTKKRGT